MKIKAIGGKIFVCLLVLTFLITCMPRGLESNTNPSVMKFYTKVLPITAL